MRKTDKQVNSIRDVDFRGMRLPVIAIYEKPAEYPDKIVARVFDVDKPTDTVMVKDTFREVQQDIARNTNKHFLLRDAKDDPCIVGTWI